MRVHRAGLLSVATAVAVVAASSIYAAPAAQAETVLIEDRDAFDGALPNLTVEDFETATIDGIVEGCGPLVSSETPTGCFENDGLQPGVVYLSDRYPDPDVKIAARIGDNFGVPSGKIIGPGEIIIGFSVPVDAVGLDLGVEYFGTLCDVAVYFVDGGPPEEFSIDCHFAPSAPRFVGFTSDRLIRGIRIDALGREASPYVDNVRFGLRAPNNFTVTTVRKHRASGSATLVVQVPGAGVTSARGKGVVVTQARSRTEQTVKLAVEPTVALWRKLKRTGKATVTLRVTFSPTGGVPKTSTQTITLVKTRR